MSGAISILAIPGSLRKQSYNRFALRTAQQLAPSDVKLEIFDLDGLPGYSEDDEQNPPAKVVELKRKIRAADALLFATPEYNYSIPGVLKNAIDWASRPYGDNSWAEKPAAIMGATVGTLGTARAQYHLRQIFVTLNILALNKPEVMISNAAKCFDETGKLIDSGTGERIQKLLAALVEWTRLMQK